MTQAQRFIKKALEIEPHQDELRELDESIDSTDTIDQIMFSKGEYIGGMAAVIIELVKRDLK